MRKLIVFIVLCIGCSEPSPFYVYYKKEYQRDNVQYNVWTGEKKEFPNEYHIVLSTHPEHMENQISLRVDKNWFDKIKEGDIISRPTQNKLKARSDEIFQELNDRFENYVPYEPKVLKNKIRIMH